MRYRPQNPDFLFAQLKLALIIAVVAGLIYFLVGCSEDEPTTDQGCLTGIRNGTTDRVFIRCCTRKEYLAGDNTTAGGTANWSNYTNHQWAACPDCK